MNEDIKHKVLVEFYNEFKNIQNLKPSEFNDKTIDKWHKFLVSNHEIIFNKNIFLPLISNSTTTKSIIDNYIKEFNIYHSFLWDYLKQNENLAEPDYMDNRLFLMELINRLDKISYFKMHDGIVNEFDTEKFCIRMQEFIRISEDIDNQNIDEWKKFELKEPLIGNFLSNKDGIYGNIKTTIIWTELNNHKFIYRLFKMRNDLTHTIVHSKLNMDSLIWSAFFCYTYTLYKLIDDWGKRKWRLTKQEKKFIPQLETQDLYRLIEINNKTNKNNK